MRTAQDLPDPHEEVLMVMYWLKEEGFGEQVTSRLLERFLGPGVDFSVVLAHLLSDGYVIKSGLEVRLSELGISEGKRLYGDTPGSAVG